MALKILPLFFCEPSLGFLRAACSPPDRESSAMSITVFRVTTADVLPWLLSLRGSVETAQRIILMTSREKMVGDTRPFTVQTSLHRHVPA